jgi:hypothetical protein
VSQFTQAYTSVKGRELCVLRAYSLFASSPSGYLLGSVMELEDGGHAPPECRPLSELQGVATQKVLLS